MRIKELIEILKEQKYNLGSLLKIVKEKQNILVNNKLEKLKDYLSLEENKILEIQITEEKRLRLMQKIFTEFQIKNERFKLEILVEELNGKVPNNDLTDIKEKEIEIKNTIKEITKTNQQNLLLVKQSSQIISETVKAVIDTSKRSIIDRKG
jgi:hypothetical protein